MKCNHSPSRVRSCRVVRSRSVVCSVVSCGAIMLVACLIVCCVRSRFVVCCVGSCVMCDHAQSRFRSCAVLQSRSFTCSRVVLRSRSVTCSVVCCAAITLRRVFGRLFIRFVRSNRLRVHPVSVSEITQITQFIRSSVSVKATKSLAHPFRCVHPNH